MNLTGTFGLIFVAVFFVLVLIFTLVGRKRPWRPRREIQAFVRLRHAVGLAVEAGNRLHLSIGRGTILGPQGMVALVGLSMLDRIARWTSFSDRPPIATSGEGALAVLSQDTLRGAARNMGAEYDPTRGILTGVTPLSFAAGAMTVIADEDVGANMLIGSFGSEVALLTEASERTGSLSLAGSDNISGQAVLYAAAQEPLIGEETFAGGAYLGAGILHTASLGAQDVLRWVIILLMIGGALLKLAGVL